MNRPLDRDFEPFPKVPRLMKDICITEKIDGTNAGILIEEILPGDPDPAPDETVVSIKESNYAVYASSRTRWITPDKDNYGFARWVEENATTLVRDLGSGMHFGEWWGAGIQRRYGQLNKWFSLFNIRKWGAQEAKTDPRCEKRHFSGVSMSGQGECKVNPKTGLKWCACRNERPIATFLTDRMGVVPVLYEGPLYDGDPKWDAPWFRELDRLAVTGSVAAPGFMNPEGIMVFHTAAGQMFKFTLEGDGHKENR
jgi:hypothetical protein